MTLDSITLVLPPAWNPAWPALGITAVASYARSSGIPVRLLDLNPRFSAFLDRRFPGPGDAWARGLVASRHNLADLMARRRLKPGVVRNQEPFGYEILVGFNKSVLPDFLVSSDNLYREFFRWARPFRRLRKGRHLVGFSLVADSQLAAALTAARLLKTANPAVRIVAGGPFVTLHAEAFARPDPLFADIDFAVPLDGERPFCDLVRRLERGRGPIAGVIDRRGRRPEVHPPGAEPIPMDSLPLPDFRLFRRPFEGIVYETARGCPWGRCKFCYHIQYYGHRFTRKSIAKVGDELAELAGRHPGASVYFADAYLPPPRFRAIAEAMQARCLRLDWWCMGKIQEGWDAELFRLGRAAGCRVIAWGLEHISERVTRFIGKPIDRELASRLLRQCRAAGIYPEVQTITGLPTETLAESRELFEYIDGMDGTFASVPHMFGLAKNSPFHLQAGEYGIAAPDDPDQALAALYPWRNPDWEGMAGLIERFGPVFEERARRLRLELLSGP